ncbi:HNH endonuclease [Marinoscillum pacificum]|uniref:HNH endonuclease n=1 Tax=Marinoscillum pacificum TaxID=392723 RepID=UPI002157A645|nr:HNH endonuclease signature motif containing protein [Marinoscillum pacificum]
MGRKRIPDEVQAEVIFKSNRECVVCDNHRRGDHIHHIDGDNSNNKFENLAFLCFDCHNEASLKGSLKKKLTPKTIIKYRDHKYQIVITERENSLKVFNAPITGLTTEDLLTTTKSAVIIVEIEKIKEEYFSVDWNKRCDVINKLHKFSDHTNFRVAVDVFNFLSFTADQTRGGMTTDVAVSIFSLILDFFPYSDKEGENEKIIELANECINIAFSLTYDSTIYLKNYDIAMYGLTILKFIYKKGKQQNLKQLVDRVNEAYNEFERTLKRPERDDLADALQLVREFKSDIEEGTLSFPPLSDNLMRLIYSD